MTLYSGSTAVASGNLSNGALTITASTQGLPAGSYPVYVQYAGDASDAASKSSAVNVVVK